VSNLAQSVILLALSESVHMVLLAMADISNVFNFSSLFTVCPFFLMCFLFTGFYWGCNRRYVFYVHI
jgi:hypothetical protein